MPIVIIYCTEYTVQQPFSNTQKQSGSYIPYKLIIANLSENDLLSVLISSLFVIADCAIWLVQQSTRDVW